MTEAKTQAAWSTNEMTEAKTQAAWSTKQIYTSLFRLNPQLLDKTPKNRFLVSKRVEYSIATNVFIYWVEGDFTII